MQNSPRMRGLKRARDLQRKGQNLLDLHWPMQRPALDVFQNQVIRPNIVDLADVRMIQRGNRPRLCLEACAVLPLQLLDRDDAVEPRVAGLPHPSHAAFTNRRNQFVWAEFVADGK